MADNRQIIGFWWWAQVFNLFRLISGRSAFKPSLFRSTVNLAEQPSRLHSFPSQILADIVGDTSFPSTSRWWVLPIDLSLNQLLPVRFSPLLVVPKLHFQMISFPAALLLSLLLVATISRRSGAFDLEGDREALGRWATGLITPFQTRQRATN